MCRRVIRVSGFWAQHGSVCFSVGSSEDSQNPSLGWRRNKNTDQFQKKTSNVASAGTWFRVRSHNGTLQPKFNTSARITKCKIFSSWTREKKLMPLTTQRALALCTFNHKSPASPQPKKIHMFYKTLKSLTSLFLRTEKAGVLLPAVGPFHLPSQAIKSLPNLSL